MLAQVLRAGINQKLKLLTVFNVDFFRARAIKHLGLLVDMRGKVPEQIIVMYTSSQHR